MLPHQNSQERARSGQLERRADRSPMCHYSVGMLERARAGVRLITQEGGSVANIASFMPLAQAITESIGGNHKKDFVSVGSVMVDPEPRLVLTQPARL